MGATAIKLAKIRLDGGTQPREKINEEVVSEYAERAKAGDEFPPVQVVEDGANIWLWDGFHRYHAAAKNDDKSIACLVRKGTQRDARMLALGANASHGLRRTNADKRKAVAEAIGDEEWGKFTDRKIADLCCVAHSFVAEIRRQVDSKSTSNGSTRTGRDGKQHPASKPKPKPTEDVSDEPAVREPGDDTDAIKAEAAKRRASGKEVIPGKERREGMKAFGVVRRLVAKIGGPELHRSCLESILATIEGKGR
jgi:hypothetical protein